MNPQMMRVISSPSSSTTGVLTLIFAIISSWPEYSGNGFPSLPKQPDNRTAGASGQAGGAGKPRALRLAVAGACSTHAMRSVQAHDRAPRARERELTPAAETPGLACFTRARRSGRDGGAGAYYIRCRTA